MDNPVNTRTSKVISLQEAAGWIKDGTILGMAGGHSREAPCAFSRELIRRGVKNLTLIPTNSSAYQTDVLLGAGCISRLYSSYVGLDYIGPAPNFRRLAESGKLEVIEFDEMGLLRGLKAAGAGVAFFALPDGMRAVDNVRANPEFFKEIIDPFTGKKVIVVPPISPEIAVIHTGKCDPYGNARELGFVDGIMHMAAQKLIITTEEIVSLEDTRAHYKEVTVFGKFVDAVVEVPYGGHPGPCSGFYQLDEEHLKEYQKAAREESTMKAYLDKYVFSCKNHQEYLEKIGIANKIQKLKYY
jgi:glutaconate CoA-transferase, subunit A